MTYEPSSFVLRPSSVPPATIAVREERIHDKGHKEDLKNPPFSSFVLFVPSVVKKL